MTRAAYFVFRCFAADGTLLYVGLAEHVFMRPPPQRRFGWWPSVARVTWEEWLDRSGAAQAHAEAIRVERPRHNASRTPAKEPRRGGRPRS